MGCILQGTTPFHHGRTIVGILPSMTGTPCPGTEILDASLLNTVSDPSRRDTTCSWLCPGLISSTSQTNLLDMLRSNTINYWFTTN
jgi:hypothetical protein